MSEVFIDDNDQSTMPASSINGSNKKKRPVKFWDRAKAMEQYKETKETVEGQLYNLRYQVDNQQAEMGSQDAKSQLSNESNSQQ